MIEFGKRAAAAAISSGSLYSGNTIKSDGSAPISLAVTTHETRIPNIPC
jgi:hypothetical protein